MITENDTKELKGRRCAEWSESILALAEVVAQRCGERIGSEELASVGGRGYSVVWGFRFPHIHRTLVVLVPLFGERDAWICVQVRSHEDCIRAVKEPADLLELGLVESILARFPRLRQAA